MPRHPCMLIVRGANGEPLSGIRFVIEGAQEPVPEMAYVTGRDGHAQVGLPPGLATIRFFLPNGTSQTALVDVDPASARTYPVTLGT